jgi:hypothetical protein
LRNEAGEALPARVILVTFEKGSLKFHIGVGRKRTTYSEMDNELET